MSPLTLSILYRSCSTVQGSASSDTPRYRVKISLFAGGLFLLALFFSPIFLAIPAFATAPALIMVGFLMMQQVTKINWNEDLLNAISAYITIFSMGFMYSISEGICFGVISYTVLHVLNGDGKKVTPLMYVLAFLFILKYALL